LQAKAKSAKLHYANIDFVVADVEEHSFDDASFDAIMAASAIPYLQHPASTFRSFCRWLRTGGKFVFSSPQVMTNVATLVLAQLSA
jgi:ubiquinone/menaquinone biosynthesis C-methylase UbiE